MNLYRNKENRKLYWAENMIHNWHYLNLNGFAGICVHPYWWNGQSATYYYNDYGSQEEALKAFNEDFEVVAELFYL